MHYLRPIITAIFTALALGLSLVLLAQVIGYTSPWIALLLMFNFMGLAKVAEPLFVLRLPAIMRTVRPWERSGKSYRQLGVHHFGALLRNTPLRYLNTGVYLPAESRDLRLLLCAVASAEATHFWAALAFTPCIAYLYLSGQPRFGTGFLVVQVLFNVYPILHLRLLRGRLHAILQRRDRHVAHSCSRSAEIT